MAGLCSVEVRGARGIGAAAGHLLAEGGAHVMLTDVLDGEGEELAQQLGPKVSYRRLDVTSADDWRKALEAAEKAWGSVNALFNNAGVVGFGSVTAQSPDEFRRIVDINLTGVFLGIHTVADAIGHAGGGVIINTSSTAGLQGYAGLAGYVASKWGVRGLSKAAALDLSPQRVRVLSLHPGPIHTPMTAGLPDELASNQPIARFGEPDEVARMVRFMITEASYSTGSEFVIDGGAVVGQVQPVAEG